MFLYLFYLIYKYLNLLFFLLNLNIIILHFITQKIFTFIYFLIIFKNHMNINLMNMINLFQLYHINLIIIYLN
jgi:hypothetical protein